MLTLLIYLAGFYLFICISAWRDIEVTRFNVIAAMVWPITLLVVLITLILDYIKWDWTIEKGQKLFNWRKPQDNWPGFAITVFYYEFQFWRNRN